MTRSLSLWVEEEKIRDMDDKKIRQYTDVTVTEMLELSERDLKT